MKPVTSLAQLDLAAVYSYKDYLGWQFSEAVELIRGRVMKMSPAPLTKHQVIVGRIFAELERFLRRKTCQAFIAPFDVRLVRQNPVSNERITTVVQPDICAVCDPSRIDEKGCIGVPDMIVEVLSPGSATRDLRLKFDLYQEFGVNEYWIVSPGDRIVMAYLLKDGAYVLDNEYSGAGKIPVRTLPGFMIEWEEIFE